MKRSAMAEDRLGVFKCHTDVLHAHNAESLLVNVASNIPFFWFFYELRIEMEAAATELLYPPEILHILFSSWSLTMLKQF